MNFCKLLNQKTSIFNQMNSVQIKMFLRVTFLTNRRFNYSYNIKISFLWSFVGKNVCTVQTKMSSCVIFLINISVTSSLQLWATFEISETNRRYGAVAIPRKVHLFTRKTALIRPVHVTMLSSSIRAKQECPGIRVRDPRKNSRNASTLFAL